MTPERAAEASMFSATALAPRAVAAPAPAPVPGRLARFAARLSVAFGRRRRVIVASEDGARVLGEVLHRRRTVAPDELCFVDSDRLPGQLMERLRTELPDEVYFDLGAGIDERVLARIGARLLMNGVDVHFVFPHLGRPPVHAMATHLGAQSVISLQAVPDGFFGRTLRRTLDVVGAAALLFVLAPLIALVAALVCWRMGRPIFYAQKRVGQRGRLFPLYKFRTMVTDAEALLRASPAAYHRYVDCNFKVPAEEDPRITPIGRLLRRTSLDELPQLWNVLRGDMSLVGPRAIVPEEVASYGDYARMLLRIKPGLTGLWQVSGRSTIGYPERARLDLQYVGRRSLAEDLKILLRTLPAVIRQRGAL